MTALIIAKKSVQSYKPVAVKICLVSGILLLTTFASAQKTISALGEWVDTSIIWFSARLTLNADSSFKYHARGCLGCWYTEGTWCIKGSHVCLTSYTRFKKYENLPGAEAVSYENVQASEGNGAVATYSIDTSLLNGTIAETFGFGQPPDTAMIYLDHAVLRLNKARLYPLRKNDHLRGIVFTKPNAF